MLTILAAVGLVAATVYSLRIVQKIFHGIDDVQHEKLPDLTGREKLIVLPMVVLIIFLGLFPQPVLHAVESSISKFTSGHAEKDIQDSSRREVAQKGGQHE